MKKYFVLDTNVLIHNPQSLYSFADSTVIIPITVIEELDRFKSSSDKKGRNVRQVLREIDGLLKKGALKTGAKMKNGGKLKIALLANDKIVPQLDANENDNKILGVAWELQKDKKMVFFVSKDVNARIKAEALGIKACDYEKEKVEYSQLYKGWKEITVPDDVMEGLYKEGKAELKGYSFSPNEHAFLRSETIESRTAVCKYDPETDTVLPIKKDYNVMGVHPLNMAQRIAFDILLDPSIHLVSLVGQAGTGKTLIALACALHLTLKKKPEFERILVARPIIPMGKDIGYLPGSKNQKLNYWMQPIFDNLEFILRRSTSVASELSTSELTVKSLMESEMLEIEALTFIRGRSIPNQLLIVDESQNLTPHEIKTIISRAGHGTKIILTGDPEQIDNPYLDANSNGLSYTVERLKQYKLFGHAFLDTSERSQLAALAVNAM